MADGARATRDHSGVKPTAPFDARAVGRHRRILGRLDSLVAFGGATRPVLRLGLTLCLGLTLGLTLGLGLPRGSPASAATTTTTTSVASAPLVGVPAAAQSNISSYPAIQRLGRWDGNRFQPVSAKSIAPGRVVFMTHGWSPGFLAPYQRLQAQSTTLVTAWTPGLVNESNQSMLDTWSPVAQALQAATPAATIVMFSWVDQSATTEDPFQARIAAGATEVNGHRMATAIDQALAPSFYASGGQVHLIGHSFGANVATTAALSLGVAPRQLTLLDSPETTLALLGGAKNDLRYKLPRLDIGRGAGQTFVDNYISFVGIRYSTFPGLDQVVDVQTAPPPDDSPGDKHSFAIVWYRTSAQNMDAGVGYAWSPLRGANDARLGSLYQQAAPANALGLNEVNGPPPDGVRTQMLVSNASLDVPGSKALRTGSSLRSSPGSVAPSSTSTTPAPGSAPAPSSAPATGSAAASGVSLGASSPTTWNLTFSTDQTSLWLDFDVVLAGEPGDSVALFVDGRQRYQAAVPGAGTGAPGSFIILYDVSPGDHVLSVTLSGPSSNEPASVATTAMLSRLRLSSTANIQRNFTSDETDALVIAALIAVVLVVVALIGFIVFAIRRLRNLTRRHNESVREGNRIIDSVSEPNVDSESDAVADPS